MCHSEDRAFCSFPTECPLHIYLLSHFLCGCGLTLRFPWVLVLDDLLDLSEPPTVTSECTWPFICIGVCLGHVYLTLVYLLNAFYPSSEVPQSLSLSIMLIPLSLPLFSAWECVNCCLRVKRYLFCTFLQSLEVILGAKNIVSCSNLPKRIRKQNLSFYSLPHALCPSPSVRWSSS